MQSRLKFWKYPIFLVLLLVVIAAFTYIYSASDIAAAPYEPVEVPPDYVVAATPEPPEEIEEPEPEPEFEPEPEPVDEPEEILFNNPTEDGFVLFSMEEAEINRGFLILVNFNHTFELPAELDLVNITTEKTAPFRVLGQNYLLRRSIIEPLDGMMQDYIDSTGNNSVAVISAFRNYAAQQRILDQQIRLRGEREARRWAAEPGHSEHHTGLAIDFGVFAGGTRSTFTGTGVTAWFRRNAHHHGFILRYPANKTRITRVAHEPWHFRYVGIPHSHLLFQKSWCLEEFIENIREYTFDEPLEFEFDDVLYEIYFVEGTEIKLPLNSEFDISGNNIDGFIVTIVRQETDPTVTDVSI